MKHIPVSAAIILRTNPQTHKKELFATQRGYGDFKTAVGEAVAEELKPIQERFAVLMQDKAQLDALMKLQK